MVGVVGGVAVGVKIAARPVRDDQKTNGDGK